MCLPAIPGAGDRGSHDETGTIAPLILAPRCSPAPRLDHSPRRGCIGVAGIGCSLRLDQQDMGLIFGDGAVLDAFWDDEYFTWAEVDRTISQLNADASAENEEKIIRVVVLVPYEFAFEFDDHQVVTVELPDDAGLPVIGESREFLG